MPKGGNGGDNKPPKIDNQTFGTIEMPADGSSIGFIEADVNPKKSTWSILEGNDDGIAIDPQTGELYVVDGSLIDHETEPSRTLKVEVNDGRKSYSAIITINISDVNEAPEITTTAFLVAENRTSVGIIEASDPEQDTLTYSKTGNGADDSKLTINSETGELSFIAPPDFENSTDANEDGVYQVEVSVTDGQITTNQLIDVEVGNVYDTVPTPVGSEFDVEAAKAYQTADVAGLPGNGYVLTWFESEGPLPPNFRVHAQIFNANSEPISGEILIGSLLGEPGSRTGGPQVATFSDGSFAITWKDSEIKLQLFNPDGSPKTNETVVNTIVEGSQLSPEIAMLSNGTFAIVWESNDDIHGQTFDADGNRIGSEFIVSSSNKSVKYPSIDALSEGGFVVTWTKDFADVGEGIQGQVIDNNGNKVGNQFEFGALATSDVVALTNGVFAVLSEEQRIGQIFDSEGNKVGEEFSLGSGGRYIDITDATALSNGGFVHVWTNSYTNEVYGQVFGPDGEQLGDQFSVYTISNSIFDPRALSVSVDTLENGDFIVTWVDEFQSINGQVFSIPEFSQNVTANENVSLAALTATDANELIGTMSDDILNGTTDDDILRALEGIDMRNGGPGQDTLEGGPGADTFILSDLDAVDLIADYNSAEGDLIDFTALFSADVAGSGSDPDTVLGEYVQLVEQGDGPVDQLQVDINGGADNFTTVATLDGDTGVRAVFDDNGVDTSGQVFI